MTITLRTVEAAGETFVSVTDLVAWVDESILENQAGPVSTQTKLEFAAKLRGLAEG